jgi:hypothetical protein
MNKRYKRIYIDVKLYERLKAQQAMLIKFFHKKISLSKLLAGDLDDYLNI